MGKKELNSSEKHIMFSGWLSQTILIAVIPFLAHLFMFAYEFGYAKEFGIPYTFITISIESVLSLSLFFLIILPILFFFSPGEEPGQLTLSAPPLFFTVVYFVLAYDDYLSSSNSNTLYGTIAILLLIGFLFVRKLRIINVNEIDNGNFFSKYLKDSRFRFFVNIFVLIWYSLILTPAFGGLNAHNKETFMISKNYPGYVVLKIYGETIIAAPFDSKSKTIKREIMIYKLPSNQSLAFSIKKLGPLHLENLNKNATPLKTKANDKDKGNTQRLPSATD